MKIQKPADYVRGLLYFLTGMLVSELEIPIQQQKENKMKSNLPLTFKDAKEKIANLAAKLKKAIAHRNAAADYSPMHHLQTLGSHVKVVRIGSEIVDVVRRYNLKCIRCKEEFLLGYWRRIENKAILLECPGCKQTTPSMKYADLEELLALAPAPLEDIFAKEK